MSQFKKLFESIESVKSEPKDESEKPPARKTVKGSSGARTKKLRESVAGESSAESVEKADATSTPARSGIENLKPPKKAGKSSSAEYTQVLTYIKKDTHKRIKKALIDDEQERNLSDLAEELLLSWLKKNEN